MQLHLNPIHAVVQLRPSMEHLKTDVSEKKNDVMSNLEVPNKTEVSNKGESIRLTKEQVTFFFDIHVISICIL